MAINQNLQDIINSNNVSNWEPIKEEIFAELYSSRSYNDYIISKTFLDWSIEVFRRNTGLASFSIFFERSFNYFPLEGTGIIALLDFVGSKFFESYSTYDSELSLQVFLISRVKAGDSLAIDLFMNEYGTISEYLLTRFFITLGAEIDKKTFDELAADTQALIIKEILADYGDSQFYTINPEILTIMDNEKLADYVMKSFDFFRLISRAFSKEQMFDFLDFLGDKGLLTPSTDMYWWAMAHVGEMVTVEEYEKYSGYMPMNQPETVAIIPKEILEKYNLDGTNLYKHPGYSVTELLNNPNNEPNTASVIFDRVLDFKFVTEEELLANKQFLNMDILNSHTFYCSEKGWAEIMAYLDWDAPYISQFKNNIKHLLKFYLNTDYNVLFTEENLLYLYERIPESDAQLLDYCKTTKTLKTPKWFRPFADTVQKLYK